MEGAVRAQAGSARSAWPATSSQSPPSFPSHPHVAGHLPRHFLVGFQQVGRSRYWIADLYQSVRLPGGRQRTNRGKRPLLAKPALAVPVQIRLRLPHNVIAVRQGLRRLRNCYGAERRSLHHFSAMQPAAETEHLNMFGKESVALAHNAFLYRFRACTFLYPADPAFLAHYRALAFSCFLCSHSARAHNKTNCQYPVHPNHFSFHFSFSSSLPSFYELFSSEYF